MSKGLSIHLGLNSVDPDAYEGWSGELNACEQDARDMCSIAQNNGFSPLLLLTREASSSRMLEALSDAARTLVEGDTLMLTYSGHGGQVPDTDGDEPDRRDETWCLYDRMVIDDELWSQWQAFRHGVRVIMLSDSCHSGTVSKVRQYESITRSESLRETTGVRGYADAPPKFRLLPYDQALAIYEKHNALYASKTWGKVAEPRAAGATVLLISGCLDNQLSADGPKNGLFTESLLAVWADGAFQGDYRRFHKEIQKAMPMVQQPNYSVVGPPNAAFEAERPFSISAPRPLAGGADLSANIAVTAGGLSDAEANRLSAAARGLTKRDLLALAWKVPTPATARLTVDDLKSIEDVFRPRIHQYLSASVRGDVSCCTCTPCCSCCADANIHPVTTA